MKDLGQHSACFVVLEYKSPVHDVNAVKVNHGVEFLEDRSFFENRTRAKCAHEYPRDTPHTGCCWDHNQITSLHALIKGHVY